MVVTALNMVTGRPEVRDHLCQFLASELGRLEYADGQYVISRITGIGQPSCLYTVRAQPAGPPIQLGPYFLKDIREWTEYPQYLPIGRI